MPYIHESEARILLSQPLRCEDALDWASIGVQRNIRVLQGGLIAPNDVATGLYVELQFRRRPRPLLISYTFSVLLRNRCSIERVYQLTVNQSAKVLKDKHSQSHEHIGGSRHIGTATWQKWSYDEVLAYFCARTNITFVPVPAHPEHFSKR